MRPIISLYIVKYNITYETNHTILYLCNILLMQCWDFGTNKRLSIYKKQKFQKEYGLSISEIANKSRFKIYHYIKKSSGFYFEDNSKYIKMMF